MKTFLTALLISLSFMFSGVAIADDVRTSDGNSCSFDASDSPYEIEAYVESTNDDYQNRNDSYDSRYDGDEERAGVRFTWSFGAPKRLDCDKLFQLQLRDKELNLREREAKLKAMEAVQNIKW